MIMMTILTMNFFIACFTLLMDNSIDNNDDDVDKSQESIMYINEILID
jgi:hypothetical protein